MNLQDIVEMSDEIKKLRKARDLLRSTQWILSTNNSADLENLKKSIDDYFTEKL